MALSRLQGALNALMLQNWDSWIILKEFRVLRYPELFPSFEKSDSVIKVNLENEIYLMYMLVFISIFKVYIKNIAGLRHECVHDFKSKHSPFPPKETKKIFLFALTL